MAVERSTRLVRYTSENSTENRSASDDVLRAAVVQATSAFDYVVHELLIDEIVERHTSGKYLYRTMVPLEIFALDQASQLEKLADHLRQTLGYQSFLAPDKLAQGLRPCVENAWDKIAADSGEPANTLKRQLRDAADWRNRIVHESDVRHGGEPNELFPIYPDDVTSVIEMLRRLGQSVIRVVRSSRDNARS